MAKQRNLQDRINGISKYFSGIEMYNGALIVKVVLPDKWNVSNSIDGTIKVAKSDVKANEYYYYANSEEHTYDDVFDLIEETIEVNETTILKLELLREKVYELREIFADETISFEKLKRLKFTFESPKKGKTKKNKTENKEEEAIDNNDGK